MKMVAEVLGSLTAQFAKFFVRTLAVLLALHVWGVL